MISISQKPNTAQDVNNTLLSKRKTGDTRHDVKKSKGYVSASRSFEMLQDAMADVKANARGRSVDALLEIMETARKRQGREEKEYTGRALN